MPPGVPIHYVDSTLDIIAIDNDFVCQVKCNDPDDSNNFVQCFVEGDEKKIINCEAKEEDGSYRMFVSLNKSFESIGYSGNSYDFKLLAKVGIYILILKLHEHNTLGWWNPTSELRTSKSHSEFST